MTFAELKAELAARGFDDLSSARQGSFVNRARAWLDDYALWPYREASVTGVAPVAVSDLGTVEAVVDTTTNCLLRADTYLRLQGIAGDLSYAGNPLNWYLAWPSGTPEIATYPTSSTVTIGVQYWKVTPDLSSDSDSPAAPSRFHQLIVDLAVQFAYRDTDNHPSADALQPQIDQSLSVMISALINAQAQGPNRFVQTSGRNF